VRGAELYIKGKELDLYLQLRNIAMLPDPAHAD